MSGPRVRRDQAVRAIDLRRFAQACRDGLTAKALGDRFGIHYSEASRLRRQVMAGVPGWRPPKGNPL